ncbi:MAG: hypothetical protein WBN48_13245, partial [Thiogranum sp.]
MDTGWTPPDQAPVLTIILNLAVTWHRMPTSQPPALPPCRAEVIETMLRPAIESNRVMAATPTPSPECRVRATETTHGLATTLDN